MFVDAHEFDSHKWGSHTHTKSQADLEHPEGCFCNAFGNLTTLRCTAKRFHKPVLFRDGCCLSVHTRLSGSDYWPQFVWPPFHRKLESCVFVVVLSWFCFFFFFKFYFYFMRMGACLQVCLCATCMQYLWRPQEGIKYPGTGVTVGCESPTGC